ncbi:MAG: FAD-dependent thymidylate synthase [Clostridium sp.]|nr:FAD-dependent thymidylate synthase [Clostridium sp.]
MKKTNIKIDILPNCQYLNEDGTFNKDEAIKLSGKIAGVCYDKEGFDHLMHEDEKKTIKRANMTLNNGHHSVFGHVNLSLNLQGVPKILAMTLNNEHEYTTSEKSGRYTPVIRTEGSIITEKEEELYNKWVEIFKIKIKNEYGNVFNDFKIQTLAQENARSLVSVFMPTTLIYTTSLRQINYIASWMEKYIKENGESKDKFKSDLSSSMEGFLSELDKLNILIPGLMTNDKNRSFSLFGSNLDKKKDYFGDVYSTNYKMSFAGLAQAQRHRTLDYKIERTDEKEYFVPPILENDPVLVNEWLHDIESVKDVIPNGELVLVNENGNYENFILKCQERLCTAAQLEIMRQTRDTLLKYRDALKESESPLYDDIEKYTHGARCTFPNYKCSKPCGFKEGITLTRKI